MAEPRLVPRRLEWKQAAWGLAGVGVLVLGFIENLFGLTDGGDVYGSDAVQYLDVARAFDRHDWASALNPLWSQGYPVLLALLRPLFPTGPLGDWHAVRTLNFSIFLLDFACFLFLLRALLRTLPGIGERGRKLVAAGSLMLFAVTQVCFGQVSRVNPDELVTALLLLVTGLLLHLFGPGEPGRNQGRAGALKLGLLTGLVLGCGFLAKSVFLPVGCLLLVIAAARLAQEKRSLRPVLAAALVFGLMTGAYGLALSRIVGYPTLGESGALNYAWHVDRLQKWVHWEGGTLPAAEAWPKPSLARFARWDTDPPDFGTPVHPGTVLQTQPLVYGFGNSPVRATYVPYFDPPYWYQGYHRVLRWRYQVIALGKSVADLVTSVLRQPMFYGLLLALLVLLLPARDARAAGARWLRANWPLMAVMMAGIAVYLPVHLEGRYVAGFLLVGGMAALAAAASAPTDVSRCRMALALLLLGFAADAIHTQRPVWHNMHAHRAPGDNMEWRIGEAIYAQGIPADAAVGVIAWTPNLHCDWAYIARVRIVSEIESGSSFAQFWQEPGPAQQATVDAFRRSGAVAVFVNGMPAGSHHDGWQQLGETTMWMYRL